MTVYEQMKALNESFKRIDPKAMIPSQEAIKSILYPLSGAMTATVKLIDIVKGPMDTSLLDFASPFGAVTDTLFNSIKEKLVAAKALLDDKIDDLADRDAPISGESLKRSIQSSIDAELAALKQLDAVSSSDAYKALATVQELVSTIAEFFVTMGKGIVAFVKTAGTIAKIFTSPVFWLGLASIGAYAYSRRGKKK